MNDSTNVRVTAYVSETTYAWLERNRARLGMTKGQLLDRLVLKFGAELEEDLKRAEEVLG